MAELISVEECRELLEHCLNNNSDRGQVREVAEPRTLFIDCRPTLEFINNGHLIGALNVYCPAIIKRRAGGSLSLAHVISDPVIREQVLGGRYMTAVVYDDETQTMTEFCGGTSLNLLQSVDVLLKSTSIKDIRVLQGGYKNFSRHYSHLCISNVFDPSLLMISNELALRQQNSNTKIEIQGQSAAQSLQQECARSPDVTSSKIQPSTPLTVRCSLLTIHITPPDGDNDQEVSFTRCNQLTGRALKYCDLNDPSQPCNGPVSPSLILPWLFLGSVRHSKNHCRLRRLGITAVLNVAAVRSPLKSKQLGDNLEMNEDEEEENNWENGEGGDEMYRRLDLVIADTATENIRCHFKTCFDFIDWVRCSEGRVLVHCHAGVSRSATVCIAYMMRHLGMSRDMAYEFVRQGRHVIAPNLNFMLQLAEFETELRLEGILQRKEDGLVVESGEKVGVVEGEEDRMVISIDVGDVNAKDVNYKDAFVDPSQCPQSSSDLRTATIDTIFDDCDDEDDDDIINSPSPGTQVQVTLTYHHGSPNPTYHPGSPNPTYHPGGPYPKLLRSLSLRPPDTSHLTASASRRHSVSVIDVLYHRAVTSCKPSACDTMDLKHDHEGLFSSVALCNLTRRLSLIAATSCSSSQQYPQLEHRSSLSAMQMHYTGSAVDAHLNLSALILSTISPSYFHSSNKTLVTAARSSLVHINDTTETLDAVRSCVLCSTDQVFQFPVMMH